MESAAKHVRASYRTKTKAESSQPFHLIWLAIKHTPDGPEARVRFRFVQPQNSTDYLFYLLCLIRLSDWKPNRIDLKMSYAGNGEDIQMYERVFAQVLGVDDSEEFATELTYYASELLHILPPGWELVIGENDLAGIPMFVYTETQETEWNHPYESEYRRKIQAKRNELYDKYANNNASFSNNDFNNVANEGSFQMSNFNASSIESNFDQSIGGLDAEAVSEVGFDSARAGGSDGGVMDPAASLEDHEIVFAQVLGVDLEEKHFLVLAFLAKELMRILPEGWELLTSVSNSGTKVPYYFDPSTRSSHWTHPYENQYKDVIARKRTELQATEPPTPLDSARSKASDGSSINSIDRLALIEAMFAGALGVNPIEEYASELNDYARELLQMLPPGWEVVVADTGKSTDAFPLFVNNNDGSNTLDHPILAEHTRSIEEMRNALQFGVLPSEFLSRTSPRIAGSGAGASAEPSAEFLAQQTQRAADEAASQAAATAAAELQARITAAERAAAEQAAAEELAAQQAAERAAAEEAIRLEKERAEQARAALIKQERLAAEQAAAEAARLAAEREAAEAAATALREAEELERIRLAEIEREREQREQELLAAKIVAEREAAEREAALRETERLRAEQEAFATQEALRLEQERAEAAVRAAELLAQQKAAELERIQELERAERIEKENIAARIEEERCAQEQADREAAEGVDVAETLRQEQEARAQQQAEEHTAQGTQEPLSPQAAEGSAQLAEAAPPSAAEADENDNATLTGAPPSNDAHPDGPANAENEESAPPSYSAGQMDAVEGTALQETAPRPVSPGEHSVVSVGGTVALDAESAVSVKEALEKVAGQATMVEERSVGGSEHTIEVAGTVEQPTTDSQVEAPDAPPDVSTTAETSENNDAERIAAGFVQDEVARELSEELATSSLSDQQVAIDAETAAVSESFVDETITKLATHAAREAFEEATAEKVAADKLAAEKASAELRAARAAEKLAAERAAQALIEKEIADQAALEVAATSLFEQELQLARQASSERLLFTERAGEPSVQAMDLEPDMLSHTMPSEGLFTVAEGPESPDSGRLSVPKLGTSPPAAPPAPADSFDMNAIQSNVIKLETQYLDAKTKDASKRRTSKRVSTPEGQNIIVPKDASKYQDELAASREEGVSDSDHEATGKGKSKSLRPLSKVSPKKEAARRRRAASTLMRSPTPGSKSPSKLRHQERLWEVRVEPDQAEKAVAGIRWHTLGCYTSYDDAVHARKTIMKIVTADSQGTILFDPRTDISDYDLTAALQATINPQPAVPMVTTMIAGYVSVSPSRAATASGAVKPSSSGMMGMFSPSRPSTSANLSNTAASSFSPPFTPGAGTMRSAMSASATGRPHPTGTNGAHALPAATDTREMIIGRVKRQTEKLSKLRVRKDLGRMQWVLETDDFEVSKITDRHRKKKGVDIEGKSEDAVKVKAKNALRVMQKARETEETVEMKTLKRLPAMEELIEADLMQVLATSKSFGDFSLTSKLVAEERRLKEELTARLAKLGKRHEASPTKKAAHDRDEKATHKPRKAGPITNRIPESNGKSSSVKLTLPDINSRR